MWPGWMASAVNLPSIWSPKVSTRCVVFFFSSLTPLPNLSSSHPARWQPLPCVLVTVTWQGAMDFTDAGPRCLGASKTCIVDDGQIGLSLCRAAETSRTAQCLIEPGLLLKSETELSQQVAYVHSHLSQSGHQHSNGVLRASILGSPPW
jgi:hypothetical protein